MGKSQPLPFGESGRVTLCPLELVHSDVWVSPIMSNEGHRYYVLFVDDFSHFTWVYLLRNKSKVISSFVHFKALVENQFSTKVKQFQCDNGGEYLSHQFQDFLSKCGIHQCLSCPYTS